MVEVFKTDIVSEQDAAFILHQLQLVFSNCKINFDLEDCDNILRLETEDNTFDINPVIVLVKSSGFKIEILHDELPKTKKSLSEKFRLRASILVLALFIVSSCKVSKQNVCIDESRINDGPCTFDYNPVCGCDDNTYGNSCQAERNGVISWEQGECETDSYKIFTSDIDNYWQAFDSVQTASDLHKQIELIQTLYIDKGTEGLKAFMDLRNFDAERLVKAINEYPKFWKSIRTNTYLVKEKEAEIYRYLKKFHRLYPGYREAKIYFTITPIRSGGTTKDSIVLVGTEIATGNSNTDVSEFPNKRLETFFMNQKTNNIVPFTIHEYVHTQQKREGKVLLGQAIAEGACDFITELVLETELQHTYLVYGRKNEQELKVLFKEEMFSEDFTNWLYNGSTTETVGDLGYFMGYAICQAYYSKAIDKAKAISEIIELDYANKDALIRFLQLSGYY